MVDTSIYSRWTLGVGLSHVPSLSTLSRRLCIRVSALTYDDRNRQAREKESQKSEKRTKQQIYGNCARWRSSNYERSMHCHNRLHMVALYTSRRATRRQYALETTT